MSTIYFENKNVDLGRDYLGVTILVFEQEQEEESVLFMVTKEGSFIFICSCFCLWSLFFLTSFCDRIIVLDLEDDDEEDEEEEEEEEEEE